MLTVAVIPARAGSRGLPNKHLKLLDGEPLIVHTIRAAAESRRIDRFIVTTDDPAVARVAERAGAAVPFLRPEDLARDETPTVDVIQHSVRWLEDHGPPIDIVVTLQATSPLRTASDIDATIALLDDPAVQSATTVIPLNLPITVVGSVSAGRFTSAATNDTELRRQSAPPAVRLTGGVYVTRRELLSSGRLLDERPAAFMVGRGSAVDIDTADDLAEARRIARRRRGGRA